MGCSRNPHPGSRHSRHRRGLHPGANRRPDIFPDLTVEQVRRVLRFAYQAQIKIIYEQRRLPLWPRDYELEGVILRHKLAALGND